MFLYSHSPIPPKITESRNHIPGKDYARKKSDLTPLSDVTNKHQRLLDRWRGQLTTSVYFPSSKGLFVDVCQSDKPLTTL